jgi:hypothetical protein
MLPVEPLSVRRDTPQSQLNDDFGDVSNGMSGGDRGAGDRAAEAASVVRRKAQTGNSAGQVLAYNAKNQTTSINPAGPVGAQAMTYTGPGQTQRTGTDSLDLVNTRLGVTTSTDGGGAITGYTATTPATSSASATPTAPASTTSSTPSAPSSPSPPPPVTPSPATPTARRAPSHRRLGLK